MGWGSSGGFFEEARVSLKEIDVEEKIEGQRTEVEKGCEEAPVLSSHHQRQHALCVCSKEVQSTGYLPVHSQILSDSCKTAERR